MSAAPYASELLEYSVVFTSRSLNHMSQQFRDVMRGINSTLTELYGAPSMAIVPGGGTFGMEAVARQLATAKRCLVLRNGWFSYRWSQIFEAASIPAEEIVLSARVQSDEPRAAFAPAEPEEVVSAIRDRRPDVVFAPHVETASGIILSDEYLKAVGEAVRAVGGLFVLDCIASGAMWVDMREANVDVLLTAPQKGWSASPCAALVLLSDRAREAVKATRSTSFAADLRRWSEIMDAYTRGGHAYHATMPTDALVDFHTSMTQSAEIGFARLKTAQTELGSRVRALLESRGFRSVAAEGVKAPGVVVSYTDNPQIRSGAAFAEVGVQIAGGVPLMCGEPKNFSTFRIGLFGIDKLQDIDGTVATLEQALDRLAS